MFDILLLVAFGTFAIIGVAHISSKSLFFGATFMFLFIYSIFAEIGYRFYPELSMALKVFFGQEYFLRFYLFNFASFLCSYLLLLLCLPLFVNWRPYTLVRQKRVPNRGIFIGCVLTLNTYLISYFVVYYERLNYMTMASASTLEDLGVPFAIFIWGLKFMAPLCVMLFVQWRCANTDHSISTFGKKLNFLMFASCLVVLGVIATHNGDRTDILAVALGIFLVEVSRGINWRKVSYMCVAVAIVVAGLNRVKEVREAGNADVVEVSNERRILMNDYYAPAHMLYGALAYEYVNPLVVLKSNCCNSLFMLKSPLLQTYIMELVDPGTTSRTASYAFYLFTEGYMFMGGWGFLYNAIMLVFWIWIWDRMRSSRNVNYNQVILGVAATQLANIARSQSAYFAKDLYMLFGPLFVLLYLSSGLYPEVISWRRSLNSSGDLAEGG